MEEEVFTRCWWVNQRERDNWEEQEVGWNVIIRWIFRKCE
jgi:hypothetical protein